jgi:hypothetical protein
MKSINKIQQEAIDSGVLDLGGTEQLEFRKVELSNTQNVLEQLAANFSIMLANSLEATNATSSGDLADSILPLSLQINGNVYEVGIESNLYGKYIDEGVNGVVKSRGAKYSFKNYGVPKTMLQSVKDYLEREGKMTRNLPAKYAVTKKEGKSWQDQKAASVAYMIKRQGIAANNFVSTATKEFEKYLTEQLGTAVKVDILNNIVIK